MTSPGAVRERTRETRGLRTRAYVERADGRVSERSDSDAESTYGVREVWSQAGAAASDQTAAEVGDAVLARAAVAQESIDAGVGSEPHMPYREFEPGDVVALEGRDGMRDPRVSAVTVELGDQVDVDVTLESRAELVERDLQRFLEGMSDATMAASSNLQRRLREVRADLIVAGKLRVDTDIESSNFATGSDGWRISGDGSAEFNDVTVRGEVEASSGEISGSLLVTGDLRGPNDTWELSSEGFRTATTGARVEVLGTSDANTVNVINGDGTLVGQFASDAGGQEDVIIKANKKHLIAGVAGEFLVTNQDATAWNQADAAGFESHERSNSLVLVDENDRRWRIMVDSNGDLVTKGL